MVRRALRIASIASLLVVVTGRGRSNPKSHASATSDATLGVQDGTDTLRAHPRSFSTVRGSPRRTSATMRNLKGGSSGSGDDWSVGAGSGGWVYNYNNQRPISGGTNAGSSYYNYYNSNPSSKKGPKSSSKGSSSSSSSKASGPWVTSTIYNAYIVSSGEPDSNQDNKVLQEAYSDYVAQQFQDNFYAPSRGRQLGVQPPKPPVSSVSLNIRFLPQSPSNYQMEDVECPSNVNGPCHKVYAKFMIATQGTVNPNLFVPSLTKITQDNVASDYQGMNYYIIGINPTSQVRVIEAAEPRRPSDKTNSPTPMPITSSPTLAPVRPTIPTSMPAEPTTSPQPSPDQTGGPEVRSGGSNLQSPPNPFGSITNQDTYSGTLVTSSEREPTDSLLMPPFELLYEMDSIRLPILPEEFRELELVTTNHINLFFDMENVDSTIFSNTTLAGGDDAVSHESSAIRILFKTKVTFPVISKFWDQDFPKLVETAFNDEWIDVYKVRLHGMRNNLFAGTKSLQFSSVDEVAARAKPIEPVKNETIDDDIEPPPEEPTSTPSSSDPTLYIAIAVGSITFIVLTTILVVFLCQQRSRRIRAYEDEKADETGSDSSQGGDSASEDSDERGDDQSSAYDMDSYSLEARQVSRLDL